MDDEYGRLLDECNLIISKMRMLSYYDLFRFLLIDNTWLNKNAQKALKSILEKVTEKRKKQTQKYSVKAYEKAKGLQSCYGEFEINDDVLMIAQVILDLINRLHYWDHSCSYPNVASPLIVKYPELIDHLDKRYKIFNLKSIDVLDDFDFGFKDVTFGVHPFVNYEFNRKMHGIMHKLSDSKKELCWVAFETGTYVPRNRYSALLYFDYYRGPLFDENILKNNDGLTEHRRFNSNEDNIKVFYDKGLEKTEFYWKTTDTTKDFMVEEIISEDVTREVDGKDHVCVKYCHSQFDLNTGNNIHFDGGMNIYDIETYNKRREVVLDKRKGIKATKHMKLFRLDGGVISNQEWIMLLGAFYKKNELVQEYLGATLPWDEING